MRATHQHRRKTKIRIKQQGNIRKKKNREKNFSFRRFFAEFDVIRIIPRGMVSFRAKVRRTGVEESAFVNRPLGCRSR